MVELGLEKKVGKQEQMGSGTPFVEVLAESAVCMMYQV